VDLPSAKRLGIKKASFHTLRHTFASLLLTKKGVDIVTVSNLLGHKNIETTMIYLHTDMQTMRTGVEKLDFWGPGKREAQIGHKKAEVLEKKTGY